MDSLTAKQVQCMVFRVRDSGRTSDKVPALAPYDFGINQDWYDRFKNEPTHQHILGDWGTYGDPEGFGSNTNDSDDENPNLPAIE